MSSIFYNADEAFEMAIRIERNGEQFYAQAAGAVFAPKVRSMLERLRDMEAGHQKLFAQLRDKVKGSSGMPAVLDPEGEVGKYLRAAADSHVFHAPSGAVLGAEPTPKQILDTAIRFEKDSIVFFLGIKDMVADPAAKDVVQGLVDEEKKHILYILETLGPLAKA